MSFVIVEHNQKDNGCEKDCCKYSCVYGIFITKEEAYEKMDEMRETYEKELDTSWAHTISTYEVWVIQQS